MSLSSVTRYGSRRWGRLYPCVSLLDMTMRQNLFDSRSYGQVCLDWFPVPRLTFNVVIFMWTDWIWQGEWSGLTYYLGRRLIQLARGRLILYHLSRKLSLVISSRPLESMLLPISQTLPPLYETLSLLG